MHAIADCDEGPKRSSQDAPGSARVLILDTDPDLRNVLAGCLLELGYEVACAARADEAVRLVANALCEERSFEVVILDITERDAEQSLRAFSTMCRLDPEIRVIATSTWPHGTWLVDHASFGFAAALAKPWGFVDLAMTLKRVLEGSEGRQHSEIRIKCRDD